MDDRALRLALEALLDEPTLKSTHRASIERGLTDLKTQRITPDEWEYLCYLIEHYGASTPLPADPVAALIAAFQDKLPSVDPIALSTGIHALVGGDTAQLDGKSLALTIERRGQTQIANLAERNVVMGNLNQLDISVHIPIPDARFDSLMQAAFQRQTHERITNAAQQTESDRLLNLRLQGFVGRDNELAAIRAQIATVRPTGGYVLIKSEAGEGKSSIIAKLIQDAGFAQTPHHFIALTTGRDYQLSLLRAVVAQLILKHRLPVSYFPEESYSTMKGEFARILDELSKHGIQETIYLDGLDQLPPEGDRLIDLSFLPSQPPPGIVIVLGSRPDEAFKPLHHLNKAAYHLPPMSEIDAFTVWRSVQSGVADTLFHDLYTALKGNALFVYLAADTIRNQSVVDMASLIRQIEQNPKDIFGIKLERIKNRSEHRWPTIWRPMLALLVVTQEPLPMRVIGRLLGQPRAVIQDAVWVMGGLVSQGSDQRVALHHLLFREYIQAHEFDSEELHDIHQRLADWCAQDGDAIWADHRDALEQARRVYARHHYITHLALAENWPTLWRVLDAGDYGAQKTRFDPSMRLYALDLDRGRESAIKAGQSTEEHIQHLPRLWKYSLLRTSLTNRVDQWPNKVFAILATIGQTHEVLERIELLSSTRKQVQCWDTILPWCDTQQQKTMLVRLYQVAGHLSGIDEIFTLSIIAKITIMLGENEQAIGILDHALAIAHTLKTPEQCNEAIRAITKITTMLATNEHVLGILDRSFTIAQCIDHANYRSEALSVIAAAIAVHGDRGRVLTRNQMIDTSGRRNETISVIAAAIAVHGDIDYALTITQSIDNPVQYILAIAFIANILTILDKPEHVLGILDRALFIAQSIDNPEQRDKAMGAIAAVIVTHGDIDRALSIAQSIDNVWQRDSSLAEIAVVIATHGDIDRALSIAQSIDPPKGHTLTLAAIAVAIATHGNIDRALSITQSIEHTKERAETMSSVAVAAATHGDIDRAVIIAQSINSWQYSETMSSVAVAAATHGDINRALSITQSIESTKERAETMSRIAEVAVTYGQHEQALAILNMALSSITQSVNEAWQQRDEAIKAIAVAIATNGDIDRALTIAQSIDNIWERYQTLGILAEAIAGYGDIDHALTIAQSIDDPVQCTWALAAIAEVTITRGQDQQALAILNMAQTITHAIDNAKGRAMAFPAIAEVTATHGDIDHALSITQSIDGSWERNRTLAAIVEAIASHGNIDRALSIAQSIDNPEQRNKAMGAIAAVIVTRGDIDRALSIAQSIDNVWQRDSTLAEIVVVIASHGDIDRALTIAQSIDPQKERAEALAAIAEFTVTPGQRKQALEILNTTLTIFHTLDDQLGLHDEVIGAIAVAIASHGDIDRALSITQFIGNTWPRRDNTVGAIAKVAATHGDIDRALSIAQFIDNLDRRDNAVGAIAEATATRGDTDRALTIAQSIDDPTLRAQTFHVILQKAQSVIGILRILHHEWFRSLRSTDVWAMTVISTPLINEYPWLGVTMLDAEEWVNVQLKRLE